MPGARPRGILFVTPARMGRRVIAERIASFLGEEPIHLHVPTPTGNLSYVQIPVLRAFWPDGGDPAVFVVNVLASLDRALGSHYSAVIRPSRFRLQEEALSILSGFCIGANVGLIIVERINARDASTQAAVALWNVLGQFTRTTGIPVLLMATTGAASQLMCRTSAASELTAGGVLCMDAPSADSREYADLCTLAYQTATKRRGPAPAWLVEALATRTHCRLALPHKVCVELAGSAGKADIASLDAILEKALYIYAPALRVLDAIGKAENYPKSRLSAFSDWLPTDAASEQVAVPQLDPLALRVGLPRQ